VAGLEQTWGVIRERLLAGAAGDALPADEAAIVQKIWGLLDHDLPHAGQLSLLLVASGLPGVDL